MQSAPQRFERPPTPRPATLERGLLSTPRRPIVQELSFHPAFDGRTMYQREKRSRFASDDSLTADTIAHMLQYAREDVDAPAVLRVAREIRADAEGSSDQALAEAIHRWMRANVKYVEDAELAATLTDVPDDAEVLIRPADLFAMRRPQGDCDDFAMGTACLLLAFNIPCAYKVAKANPIARNLWSHIYVVALLPTHLALDCSHGPYPGWETRPIFQSRLWPVIPMKTINLSALRGATDTLAFRNPHGIVRVSLRGLCDDDPAACETGSSVNDGSDDGSGFDWGSLVGGITSGATSILGKRYGVPQLNPGQLIRGPNGQLMYQGFPGQNPTGINSLIGNSGMGGMGTILLLAVGAIVLVIALKGKG